MFSEDVVALTGGLRQGRLQGELDVEEVKVNIDLYSASS